MLRSILVATGILGMTLSPGCRSGSDVALPAEAPGQPALYVEDCGQCHPAQAEAFASSGHAGKHLACGKCHTPAGHPDFAVPVSDATCGGCHSAQYQQVLESQHFATRVQQPLNADRAARQALRADGFRVERNGRAHFAGDAKAGELGGRLCAGCHLDGHAFRLAKVGAADACTTCHTDRGAHFPVTMPGFENRCLACHVRQGETAAGQKINSHRFARPG